MLSVGETLKRARLEQGLDLGTVAARTKISAKYLEAIESDNRKILPGGFFYRSFVEQYANSLSLDTQEIGAEVDRVLSADEPLPLPGFESVVARNVPPVTFAHRFHTRRLYLSAASLALLLAACWGVYGWWHGVRSFDHLLALARPTLAVANKSAPVPAPLPSDTKPVDAEEGSIAPRTAISDDKSPAAVSDYKVLLDLMAREATWVALSSDGKPVFSGILQANQTKTVGGKQYAKLRVGNAAGIQVRLNGRMLGPLGARGQVLVVLFTPHNFEIFSPPKESD